MRDHPNFPLARIYLKPVPYALGLMQTFSKCWKEASHCQTEDNWCTFKFPCIFKGVLFILFFFLNNTLPHKWIPPGIILGSGGRCCCCFKGVLLRKELRLSQGYCEMANWHNNDDVITSYSNSSSDRIDFVKSLLKQQHELLSCFV